MSAAFRIIRHSAIYAGCVFCAGFALGVVRVLWLEPSFGPLGAVALELPIMLAISWSVSAALLRKSHGDWSRLQSLAMGGFAFVLLIAMELALGAALTGDGVAAFFARLSTLHGALGLAAQIAFGLIPWVQSLFAPQKP